MIYLQERSEEPCWYHDENIANFFCNDCKENVCGLCFEESGDHFQHYFEPLKDSEEIFLAELFKIKEEEKLEMSQKIISHFDFLHGKLQLQEKKIRQEMEQNYQEFMKEILKSKNLKETCKKDLQEKWTHLNFSNESEPKMQFKKVKLKFKDETKLKMRQVELDSSRDDLEIQLLKVISPDEFYVHRKMDIPTIEKMHRIIAQKVGKYQSF